jgi:hypothetical protein
VDCKPDKDERYAAEIWSRLGQVGVWVRDFRSGWQDQRKLANP